MQPLFILRLSTPTAMLPLTYKSRSKGERSNHSTGKTGCPFVLRLKSTKYGQVLEVMKFDNT